jgi:hypothetical protein
MKGYNDKPKVLMDKLSKWKDGKNHPSIVKYLLNYLNGVSIFAQHYKNSCEAFLL